MSPYREPPNGTLQTDFGLFDSPFVFLMFEEAPHKLAFGNLLHDAMDLCERPVVAVLTYALYAIYSE